MNGARPAVEGQPVHDRACRTEGCENKANATWSRGALSGLCWETCIPAMRVTMREAGRKRAVVAAGRTLPDPPPPPPPPPVRDPIEPKEPTPFVPEPEDEPSLADLASAVEHAKAQLDEAERIYEAAVDRFLAHPIQRELVDTGRAG